MQANSLLGGGLSGTEDVLDLAMVGDRERILAAPPAVQPKPEVAVEPTECKACVLVVDDLADNRSVLKSVLEPCGYEVLTAATGDEACEVLGGRTPDLILSDLHLANEPDFSLLRRVKTRRGTGFP